MQIVQTRDTMNQIYLDAVKIRQKVFVQEQKVPIELEIDRDEAYAIHFVLYDDKQPLATVRLLPQKDDEVKIQRMAVLKEARGLGYGKEILQAAEKFAQDQGFIALTLGAQLTALPFYRRLGYEGTGPTFYEAGIEHQKMTKFLNQR